MRLLKVLMCLLFLAFQTGAFAQVKKPVPTNATISTASVWKNEPTSFLGIKLGAPLLDSVSECPRETQYGVPRYQWVDFKKVCFEKIGDFFEIHNGTGKVTVNHANGNVGLISATFKDWIKGEVRDALIEKYGPPSKQKISTVTTKVGVAYERVTLIWEGNDVRITFDSVGYDVDTCEIAVQTKAYDQQVRERYRKTVEGLKEDF